MRNVLRSPVLFALRTVVKGQVKIYGHYFQAPDPYNGELDHQRFAFGLYHTMDAGGVMSILDFVSLWGTEEAYYNPDIGYGPECVDGRFPWAIWHEVKDEKAEASS